MTGQLDALEINHTLIQINNIENNISLVEKSVDSIKIPGAKLFFKFFTCILNEDNPSDTQKILKELEMMDKKLDNSFNITLSALDVNNLQVNAISAKASMSEVSHLVMLDDSVGYKKRIAAEVSNLHRLAVTQIELGIKALEHFDAANSTGNGELKELIGKYLKISSFVAEAIGYMQYSYNMILQRNVKVEERLGKDFEKSSDYKLGKEIEDYSRTVLNSYDDFLSKDLPKNVPKWCKKIFLGEKFQLKNSWCGYYVYLSKDKLYWGLNVVANVAPDRRSDFEFNLDEDETLWDICVSDGYNKEAQVFSSDCSNVYGETIPLLTWVGSQKGMRDKRDKYTICYCFERLIIRYPRKTDELIGAKMVGHADLRYEQIFTSKFSQTDGKAQWEVV